MVSAQRDGWPWAQPDTWRRPGVASSDAGGSCPVSPGDGEDKPGAELSPSGDRAHPAEIPIVAASSAPSTAVSTPRGRDRITGISSPSGYSVARAKARAVEVFAVSTPLAAASLAKENAAVAMLAWLDRSELEVGAVL